MKRIICIVLWCLIFYVAGLFKVESVLAAVLTFAIFGIFLFIMAIYQLLIVKIDLKMEKDFGQKESNFCGKIVLINRSFFPVSQFEVRLEYVYEPYGNKKAQRLTGGLDGRGKVEIPFSIQPMYSGTMKIVVSSIRIWDMVGFFHKKRKTRMEKRITVFPIGISMNVKPDRLKRQVLAIQEKEQNLRLGNTPPDVFQIHPYQQGESLRAIHWKLTARLDDMISRQYGEEMQILPILYLQREKNKEMNVQRLDAYWEVAEALSRGLLEEKIPHIVAWNDQKEQFHGMEIHEEKDFLSTWKMAITYSFEIEEERVQLIYEQLRNETERSVPIICVNQSLKIARDGEEVIHFSWDYYLTEMEKRWVSV